MATRESVDTWTPDEGLTIRMGPKSAGARTGYPEPSGRPAEERDLARRSRATRASRPGPPRSAPARSSAADAGFRFVRRATDRQTRWYRANDRGEPASIGLLARTVAARTSTSRSPAASSGVA